MSFAYPYHLLVDFCKYFSNKIPAPDWMKTVSTLAWSVTVSVTSVLWLDYWSLFLCGRPKFCHDGIKLKIECLSLNAIILI